MGRFGHPEGEESDGGPLLLRPSESHPDGRVGHSRSYSGSAQGTSMTLLPLQAAAPTRLPSASDVR